MQEIKNFLTPDECQELIAMIDSNHSRSSVVVGGTDRSDNRPPNFKHFKFRLTKWLNVEYQN